jgi:hypothetical protein
MAERSSKYGEQLRLLKSEPVRALLATFDDNDVSYITRYLSKQGWITDATGPVSAVTPQGWIQVEQWKEVTPKGSQAFVAMWFEQDLEPAWLQGFEPAIRGAGYDPLRLDLKQHNNKICDEIVAEIRRSKFLVADFTGHRGGVYYEAGFAAGLSLPVIFTCRKDQLNALHFDVRQYNCLDWESTGQLRSKLEARISATIGQGPKQHL